MEASQASVRDVLAATTRTGFRPPAMDLIRAGFWIAVGWLIVFPVVMVVLLIAAVSIFGAAI